MNKSRLRKTYLSKQKSLSSGERSQKSLQISATFLSSFDLSETQYLHLFLSIRDKGELDTSFLFEELWENHPNLKTIVPRVNFEIDQLEHVEYRLGSILEVSDWGIPEPSGDELIGEQELDLILVPMLCFDSRGYRVGYGKGFYDKFLIRCREDCLKIGLSLFEPVNEIEDVQDFDVSLDFCVTPDKLWRFD